MKTLARFSVLALALVGFTASTVVSHSQTASNRAHAGKLGTAAETLNHCTPTGGCQIDY